MGGHADCLGLQLRDRRDTCKLRTPGISLIAIKCLLNFLLSSKGDPAANTDHETACTGHPSANVLHDRAASQAGREACGDTHEGEGVVVALPGAMQRDEQRVGGPQVQGAHATCQAVAFLELHPAPHVLTARPPPGAYTYVSWHSVYHIFFRRCVHETASICHSLARSWVVQPRTADS